MNSQDLNLFKKELDEAIEVFQMELKNVRTGRANPSLVEDLKVDYYGVPTPMKQMASVSTSDARTIVISPWGKDSLAKIEKAIAESDLNLSPSNDGNVVRISMPPLTEERRSELVKVVGKKAEEARIRIRKIREDVWGEVQRKEKAGEISEDEKFKNKDEIQKVVDEYNKKVEEVADKKEKEVMEV